MSRIPGHDQKGRPRGSLPSVYRDVEGDDPDLDTGEAFEDVQALAQERLYVRRPKRGVKRKSQKGHHGFVSEEVLRAMGDANMFFIRKQLPEALEACRSVIQRLPNYMAAHQLMGEVYKEQQDLPRAMASYLLACAAEPKNPLLWKERARLAERLGRADEARDAWVRAASLDPADGALVGHAVQLCVNAREPNVAKRVILRALNSPANARPMDTLETLVGLQLASKDLEGLRDSLSDSVNWAMGLPLDQHAAVAAAAPPPPGEEDDDEEEEEEEADEEEGGGAGGKGKRAAPPDAGLSRFRAGAHLLRPRPELVQQALPAVKMLVELLFERGEFSSVARLIERAHRYMCCVRAGGVDSGDASASSFADVEKAAVKGEIPLELAVKYGVARLRLDEPNANRGVCFSLLRKERSATANNGDLFAEIVVALSATGKRKAALTIVGEMLAATAAAAATAAVGGEEGAAAAAAATVKEGASSGDGGGSGDGASQLRQLKKQFPFPPPPPGDALKREAFHSWTPGTWLVPVSDVASPFAQYSGCPPPRAPPPSPAGAFRALPAPDFGLAGSTLPPASPLFRVFSSIADCHEELLKECLGAGAAAAPSGALAIEQRVAYHEGALTASLLAAVRVQPRRWDALQRLVGWLVRQGDFEAVVVVLTSNPIGAAVVLPQGADEGLLARMQYPLYPLLRAAASVAEADAVAGGAPRAGDGRERAAQLRAAAAEALLYAVGAVHSVSIYVRIKRLAGAVAAAAGGIMELLGSVMAVAAGLPPGARFRLLGSVHRALALTIERDHPAARAASSALATALGGNVRRGAEPCGAQIPPAFEAALSDAAAAAKETAGGGGSGGGGGVGTVWRRRRRKEEGADECGMGEEEEGGGGEEQGGAAGGARKRRASGGRRPPVQGEGGEEEAAEVEEEEEEGGEDTGEGGEGAAVLSSGDLARAFRNYDQRQSDKAINALLARLRATTEEVEAVLREGAAAAAGAAGGGGVGSGGSGGGGGGGGGELPEGGAAAARHAVFIRRVCSAHAAVAYAAEGAALKLRSLVSEHPYDTGAWVVYRLLEDGLAGAVGRYEGLRAATAAASSLGDAAHHGRNKRFFLRAAAAHPFSVPLLLCLAVESMDMRTSHKYPLAAYAEVARLRPAAALPWLGIAAAEIASACARTTANRHTAALKGMAFMARYAALREGEGEGGGPGGESAAAALPAALQGGPSAPLRLPQHLLAAESAFNMGRAAHTLGLLYLAEPCYRRALAVSFAPPPPPFFSDGEVTACSAGGALDVRREAAFNLALLLKQSGDAAGALAVTHEFLSYD
jgi:Tfp pilus assembly protein PilF